MDHLGTRGLADYIPQSRKWEKTSGQPAVGDIVVFLKEDNECSYGNSRWKMGQVVECEHSVDGLIRTVVIEYRNENEKKRRRTRRSARKIAILVSETDSDVIDELNEAAKASSVSYFMNHPD